MTIERLQRMDTCLIYNAIEQFNVRLRNEGFMNGSVHCQYPKLPPRAGYAVPGNLYFLKCRSTDFSLEELFRKV